LSWSRAQEQATGQTLTQTIAKMDEGSSPYLGRLPKHVASPDPSLYWSDNYVVLDFETTTQYKGSPLVEGNRLVLACWLQVRGGRGSAPLCVKHRFGSEYKQGELLEAIAGADFIVAHNTKFELGWLKRCGIDLRKVVIFDTIIAEHVLGGNRYFPQQLSLNMCLARRGMEPKEDVVGRMIKGGCLVEDIPQSWLLKYCKRDVTACHQLFLDQRTQLFEENKEHLQYQRCLVTPALTDMEFNGLQLDKEIVHEATKEMEDEYARSTTELQELCEGTPPTSSKQLAEFVFVRLGFKVPRDYKGTPMQTPGGNYSVAADVMERLRGRTDKQREFLVKYREWKELDTRITKYLRKFRDCCEQNGGRLRAIFNQCNARTHRLSSSGLVFKIQFQNMARTFKKFFRSRNDGWSIGEIDGAQLEFRVAVHMGRDDVGLRNLRTDGFDVHGLTAETLGVDRQSAKPLTFKPLYGGSGGTPEQQRYFQAFKETYKGISTTQRRWLLGCLNSKRVDTEYGLTFYFPNTVLRNSGWITNTTNIYNYPIQGFATAEIIPIGLVCAWHRMGGWESFLVNTVHDSIIAELHPDEIGAWHDLAKQCFLTDTYNCLSSLYSINLCVPLGAGVLVGSHWGDQESKDSEALYNAPEAYYLEAAKEAGMI